ncbi:hypothetical protein [Rhodoplanes sp. Z2-YC6860]|uniref:hypothetical protein n=1 Tax=Rhodoplanes sp. Z2-YC6860 TaxID=674703 RepID=UPI0012ED6329|nr:hypothetical protein [Rhodoplanes sp. Z2-YC6860]
MIASRIYLADLDGRALMRLSLFLTAATLLLGTHANAADLTASGNRGYVTHRAGHASRVVIVHHRRFYAWKRIGYPCLLTPDQIVSRNWNGPQCRWADNVSVLP